MNILNGVCTALNGVKFDLSIVDVDGSIKKVNSGKNVILDTGLDLLGNSSGHGELTRYCAVGTGTDPTQRDSGIITASRAGNVVTASASFFEAGDVGRLIKFDSGEEAYIQTFNNDTEVITVDSGTIAASEFTVWYVDDTGLQAESTRTGNMRTDSGDNERTLSAGVLNYKRTHLFPAEVANITYNEIGWSSNSGGGTNLFNRALIPGGISLLIGQQLLVESNLEVIQGPQSSIVQSDVGSGGFDTTGLIQIEGTGLQGINSSGNAVDADASGDCLEPFTDSGHQIRVLSQKDAFNAYNTPYNAGSGVLYAFFTSQGPYSNGTYFRDKFLFVDTSDFDSAQIRSLCLCNSADTGLRVNLDTDQSKNNSETLTITFRMSWGRILVNS